MSEKLPLMERREAAPTAERQESLKAHAPEKPQKAEKDPALAAREAREAVSETVQATNPLEKLRGAESAPQMGMPANHVNRELKQITLRRELQHIRRKLPAPQRALSHIVHQPVVRAVSEAAGKTVSRPSGLLGGGLVALLGTSSYLWLAHHQGFRYNYAVFLFLFAAGFLIGLVLELAVWAATRKRSYK